MRPTKTFNLYLVFHQQAFSTWEQIATEMNKLQNASGCDARRCRERAGKLIQDFKKQERLQTGDAAVPKTEMDRLLEFCIEEVNKTEHCKKENQEKEAAAKAIRCCTIYKCMLH